MYFKKIQLVFMLIVYDTNVLDIYQNVCVWQKIELKIKVFNKINHVFQNLKNMYIKYFL